MSSLKKLVFAPIFLISFYVLISQVSPIFKSFYIIFSFSLESIIQLLIVSLLLSFSAFLYALYTALANDWRINLADGVLTILIPFLFLENNLAIVFGVLLSISLALAYFTLQTALASYLNFDPAAILGPSIRQLTTLLIITTSIVYFLSINKVIAEKGFQIPDSLLDASLKFAPVEQTEQNSTLPQLSLPKEQLELLKKNPDFLKQSGIDPKILNSLDQGTKPSTANSSTKDLIKQTVKEQFQNLIKPYQSFIAPLLAVLLFFTLQAFTALVNLLIYPLLWITFYILEKTSFITFTTEQRTVKKMVV